MVYILDAPAQASWRTSPTSVDFYLFLHEPTVVFKARANTGGIAVYPNQLFLYDGVTVGAYTDLREDMLLLIGSSDGADDYGRVRLRKNANTGNVATSTILYINRSSQGAFDGEVDLVDDAYLTVLDAFWLHSIPPLIDSNGIIYEDAESAFTDSKHLLPIANAGVDFLEVLDTVGSTIQKTFGELASYATAPGATLSSYVWTFPDAQTSTSAAPTITFTADTVGYYSLAVTDSLGNVKTSRRFMAVVNKDHANLIKNFEITSHVARVDGQEMQIVIRENIPYGTYPDGTEALIAMRERRGTTVGGLVGSTGFENMIFAGWLGPENMSGEATRSGYLTNTTLTLLDTAGKLKTLPGFTEVKERESTPTTWAHMKGANIDRYVVSILDHRSNAARRVDIIWSGTGEDYAFTILGSDGGNLYDQADQRCQAIAYKLTCDRYGRLIMRPDPQLQAEADKTTDVIVPIAESDWSQLQRVYTRSPRTHWDWGEAIQVSTDNASAELNIQTLWNVSPGLAPGQGLAAATSGEQLAQDQDELNVRERKRYEARLNRLFGNIDVALARDGYFCDPALFKWVRLEITSEHAGVRGRSWISEIRFLPIEMNYRYDHRRGVREQRIALEKEVVTTRTAVTYIPPIAPGFTAPALPNYTPPSVYPPVAAPTGLLMMGTVRLGLFMHRDYSAETWSLFTTTNGSTWTETTKATLGASGQWYGYQQNPYAPDSGWILTDEQVGYLSGVPDAPAYSAQSTLGIIGGDVVSRMAIHTYIATPNFVLVTFYLTNAGTPSRDGFYFYVTTDGVNWTGGIDSAAVGGYIAWCSGHVTGQAFIADTIPGTGGKLLWRLRKTTTAGASWSVYATMSDPGGGAVDYSAIGLHFPYHNNANDDLLYLSSVRDQGSGVYSERLFRVENAGIPTLIDTPDNIATAGGSFEGMRGMDTYVSNRSIMAVNANRFAFADTLDVINGGLCESPDAGANWTPSSFGSDTLLRGVAISGDNSDWRWYWGQDGTLLKTITGAVADAADISGDLPDAGTDPMDNAIRIIFGV